MSININSCRICLVNNGLVSIFDKFYDTDINIVDMIMNCSNIRISPDDEFLNTICVQCVEKTNIAYHFKLECERSDMKMRNFFIEEFNAELKIASFDALSETEHFLDLDSNSLDNSIEYETIDEQNEKCNNLLPELKVEILENYIDNEANLELNNERTTSFECDLCKREFKCKSQLKNHRIRHTNEKKFVCDICSKSFYFNYALQRHLKTHSQTITSLEIVTTKKSYKCNYCTKLYSCDKQLKQHLLMHTSGLTLLECDICYKKFDIKKSYLLHKKRHNKQFCCEFCSKQFICNYELNNHRKVHTSNEIEKSFICKFCNKSFSRKCYLNIHTRIHTGEKPAKCRYCDKSFSNPSNLNGHLKQHTGDKNHICTICNQRFSHPSVLKVHIRKHTGEKPFKCDICNKTFILHCRLKNHQIIHSGLFPYKCDICDKNFKHSSHFSRHKKIHTGEKNFVCKFCDSKYNQSYNLIIHMRRFCKKNPDRNKDKQCQIVGSILDS